MSSATTRKIIRSKRYIPIFSVTDEDPSAFETDLLKFAIGRLTFKAEQLQFVEQPKIEQKKNYFSFGTNELTTSEKYNAVSIFFTAPLVKDGIYFVMETKDGKKKEKFCSVLELFDLVPLQRHYPSIPKGTVFEGYILGDGKFISSEFFDKPNPTQGKQHYPCRNTFGTAICYSDDINGEIQKNYDPYKFGLTLNFEPK